MSHKAIDERVKDGVYCVVVAAECDICHAKKTFNIPEPEWMSWTQGGLIQNVMPSLPASDRELLISSVCEPCFENLFEGYEEGDEEEDEVAF